MRRAVLFVLAVARLLAQPEPLAPHSTRFYTLRGDESREYRIPISADQVVDVSIREEQGIAGIVLVLGPDGNEIARLDIARRTPAAKTILIGPGESFVKVVPANHSSLDRSFELSIGEPRSISASDLVRRSAERALGSGEAALSNMQPNYLDAALDQFQASLRQWEQIGDRSRQADVLDHIGFVLHFQGKMKTSLEAYQSALNLSRADQDAGGQAASLRGLALTYEDTSQLAKAAELANQALEIDCAAGDLRGQAEAVTVLGLGFLAKGDNDQARSSFDLMLGLAGKAGDRLREADARNDLGLLEYQLGDFGEAEKQYSQALSIEREENERVKIAQELNNLGVLYSNLGDQRASLRYLEEALPIRKALAQPGSYANTIYNAGVAHAALGEFQQALECYRQALPIFRSVSHRPGEAYTLNQLGEVYIWLGEVPKAEQLLARALAIRRAISDRRGETQTLLILGDAQSRDNRDATALKNYRDALSIARSAGYQREESKALNGIASILIRSGERRSALDSSQEALELTRKIGDRMDESAALNLEGMAWRELGETGLAREALEQALAIRREAGVRPAEAATLIELARLDAAMGQIRQASKDVGDALDLTESIRANFGSRELRMEAAASHRSYYDLAIDLAMQQEDPVKALEISERARARSFLDLAMEARLDLRRGADPALLEHQREIGELLDAKHDRLMRLLGSTHSAASEIAARREIDNLIERYDAVETQIRTKTPQYAALTQPKPLSLSAIQALLPDDRTSVVEFWLGNRRSYVWIVSRSDCRGFPLPERGSLEALARRAYAALNAANENRNEPPDQRNRRIQAAQSEFSRLSESLGRLLLAPLDTQKQTRRLWIVPDGALAYVPFAALRLPRSGNPLVTRYEITELPSVSVLAALREQPGTRSDAAETAAVFADPVFGSDDERVIHASPAPIDETVTRAAAESGIADLRRLYFSRQEADAIRAFAPHTTFRALDFEASRAEVLKTDLRRYRVIHFATHGLMDSRHPELSGIVLSLVDRKGRPQDGFLRLHEIYNLKLNADLVVLSGCQTALGEDIQSEGIIGLTRGFLYAGSAQVIASLWSIRDRAAAEFMRRFYDGLLRRKLTPEAALRSAQLSMMRNQRWNDPYYWAAFVLQGAR